MEGGGRGARIALYAVCSAFAALAVTISLYYLRDCKRNRKKGSKKGILHSSLRVPDEEATTSFTEELELAEVFKDNGHGEFTRKTISSLLRMLDRVQDHMLDKLLVALLNCSAFTRNQVNNIAQLRLAYKSSSESAKRDRAEVERVARASESSGLFNEKRASDFEKVYAQLRTTSSDSLGCLCLAE